MTNGQLPGCLLPARADVRVASSKRRVKTHNRESGAAVSSPLPDALHSTGRGLG